MTTGNKFLHILFGLGVGVAQLIMTQIVTFMLSLLVPGMGDFPGTHPFLFVLILGISFTIGVFVTGWLAIKIHLLKIKPMLSTRLLFTLVCAYIPLLIALVVYRTLEPGNPFFSISMLAAVIGFYLPGWIWRK